MGLRDLYHIISNQFEVLIEANKKGLECRLIGNHLFFYDKENGTYNSELKEYMEKETEKIMRENSPLITLVAVTGYQVLHPRKYKMVMDFTSGELKEKKE
jgi:hypothetical protein